MGCKINKEEKKVIFQDNRTHQRNQIKIERNSSFLYQNPRDEEDREVKNILSPVKVQITNRKPQQILQDIVKLSNKCIEYYNEHDIDTAFNLLQKIQKDIKQLEERGFQVQMNKHFKEEFIELSHVIGSEYQDMIDFNNEILRDGWKLQKDKKNFKVFSRIQGQTVGIKLESILDVPFQNFIAVLIQPKYYKDFLPFIKKSEQVKDIRRNCKLGAIEMSFPIIADREAYFQGVVYNRLNNGKGGEKELFMYSRSFHNRKDLQKQFDYEVKLNNKCVQLDYKYVVVKYVPLSESSGKMIMGVNIDLKLAMLPLTILEMVSISFSNDFFGNIVKISQNFEGSIWDKGVKENPELFQFIKNTINQYLLKTSR